MGKLIFFILLIGFVCYLQSVQLDEERALQVLFRAKHAVNYAAHAAASEIDERTLAQGIAAFDTERAHRQALRYLQWNMRLDSGNRPLPDSMWKEGARVVLFRVIDERDGTTFPYTYRNESLDYQVTLQRPGVILAVAVTYPRLFPSIGPITWQIKSAAEIIR